VTELPEGWLGKVHALHRGLSESTGELVLFTDADVHFSPGVFRKAVSYLEHRRLDHLPALPNVWPRTPILDSMLSIFLRHFVVLICRPWLIGKPGSRACIGVGAFNLVRREVFERSPGFEWLRGEIADDMGVAILIRQAGGRAGVAAAFGDVGLHWYTSVADAARGSEKSWGPMCRFSLRRAVVVLAVTLAFELSPILAVLPLFFGPTRAIGYVGAAAFAVFAASVVALARWVGASPWRHLLAPLAVLLLAGVFMRAAIICWRRGGLEWRGTFYPTEALRAGSRVRVPWKPQRETANR
ncbi:MAG: glycosyltransferase family 2 protein, partial [Planctomycetota bacterium]